MADHEDRPSTGEQTAMELATVELLGALAYGQLRSFEVTARAIRNAPDSRAGDALAEFAVREHAGYSLLREHLSALTDLPEAVMDRQKPHFDTYFDRVPVDDDWFSACTFFSLGLPIAGDFGRNLAPALDSETALVVVGALSDRGPFERFAIDELREQLVDAEAIDRARHLGADVLGRALTGFQGVMSDTDALKVLLDAAREPGETGEARVKRLAIEVMSGHRRRVIALGLEGLEDVR